MSAVIFSPATGTASISPQNDVFVGATMEGSYPPTGLQYRDFAFKPEAGKEGLLIFRNAHRDSILEIHHVRWDADKIVVDFHWRGKGAKHLFNYVQNIGLVVQVGKVYYTTHHQPLDGQLCHQVSPVALLKYVEGKIDAEELRRHSLKLKLAQVKQTSLETQNRLLETRIRGFVRENTYMAIKVDTLNGELGDEYIRRVEDAARYTDRLTELAELTRQIESIPRWIRWLCNL